MNIHLGAKDCAQCAGVSSGLVDLMLFHGRSKGLFSVDVPALRRRYLSADFKSDAWLPLYEVERRGWDGTAAFQKLGTDQDEQGLYDHLRANAVEFYVTEESFYSVQAFAGWNLLQDDFGVHVTEPFEFDFDDFGYEWDGENYP
jgi:hypothetical protein